MIKNITGIKTTSKKVEDYESWLFENDPEAARVRTAQNNEDMFIKGGGNHPSWKKGLNKSSDHNRVSKASSYSNNGKPEHSDWEYQWNKMHGITNEYNKKGSKKPKKGPGKDHPGWKDFGRRNGKVVALRNAGKATDGNRPANKKAPSLTAKDIREAPERAERLDKIRRDDAIRRMGYDPYPRKPE